MEQTIELNGQKWVILPHKQYLDMVDDIEDYYDLPNLAKIKERLDQGLEETYPASLVDELTNPDNSPVKVFRKYRGLTQKELAEKVGVSLAQIKKIEGKDSDGSIKTLKKIAKVLNVEPGELL